jgi:hypothetical protein
VDQRRFLPLPLDGRDFSTRFKELEEIIPAMKTTLQVVLGILLASALAFVVRVAFSCTSGVFWLDGS